LTHAPPRVSPMRTASGYQAPAVPYHTPIVTDFSTPNLILPSGTRNILPTEIKSHSEPQCLSASVLKKNYLLGFPYSRDNFPRKNRGKCVTLPYMFDCWPWDLVDCMPS
jgi:hypothetical protein